MRDEVPLRYTSHTTAAEHISLKFSYYKTGTFDYDVSDGTVMFRVVNSFRNCPMSMEIIDYLVHITVGTVDEYNDKLVDLAKGRMTLDQFMSAINN